MADAQATANTIGDEPMQIHRHFPDIPVAVCENRVRGIKQLQRMVNDLQVVILDDALQHRKIKCGMNVLLTTADNLYINDHLLPLGHLRDLKHRSLAAHAIIVTKCPENMRPIDKRVIDNMLHLPAFQQLYFSRFKYQDFEPSLTEHKQKVLVLSAIANPQYLFRHVKKMFPKATCLAFPDHHHFTKKDEALIENKAKKHDIVFTTAKDYERLLLTNLPNVLGDKLQVIPVTVQIDVDAKSFEKQVITYIDETLRKNSKQHLK